MVSNFDSVVNFYCFAYLNSVCVWGGVSLLAGCIYVEHKSKRQVCPRVCQRRPVLIAYKDLLVVVVDRKMPVLAVGARKRHFHDLQLHR